MPLPDWATSSAGSRTRVALWLLAEVGEGRTFTKAQLREAFPQIEQIDRRMRDLRTEGWTIATYREDRSLAADELRLVKVGGRVWETDYRPRANAATERDRRATLAADDYVCRYCGIGPGEPHRDEPLRTAKLSVATLQDSSGPRRLTLCDRCLPSPRSSDDPVSVVAAVRDLAPEPLAAFREWITRQERPRTDLELLWARYRRLPASGREEVERYLERTSGE